MNLRQYFQRNIKVTFTNGVTTIGFVEIYTPAVDTEDERFDEIGITGSPEYPWLLGVSEEEIKTIEVMKE